MYVPSSENTVEAAPRRDSDFVAAVLRVQDLVRVALDDFGTGYSSLLNLSHLPVDLLKIPRPFLKGVGDGHSASSGVPAGTIALARHLGLTSVAEGIELPEQHNLLARLDCDLGQGYLLGRPCDAARTAELLDGEPCAPARHAV